MSFTFVYEERRVLEEEEASWCTVIWNWFTVQKVKGQGHTAGKCPSAFLFVKRQHTLSTFTRWRNNVILLDFASALFTWRRYSGLLYRIARAHKFVPVPADPRRALDRCMRYHVVQAVRERTSFAAEGGIYCTPIHVLW